MLVMLLYTWMLLGYMIIIYPSRVLELRRLVQQRHTYFTEMFWKIRLIRIYSYMKNGLHIFITEVLKVLI